MHLVERPGVFLDDAGTHWLQGPLFGIGKAGCNQCGLAPVQVAGVLFKVILCSRLDAEYPLPISLTFI